MADEELLPPAFVPPTRDELIAGIRKACGIDSPSIGNRALLDMLNQAADKAAAALSPRSRLKETVITGCEAGILKGRELSIESQKLCRLVAGMTRPISIFGFALTLGGEIDALIKHAQQTSLAGALLFDAAGSYLIERYASQMEDHLRAALALRNLELSARFSPGYCDWDMAGGQQDLFRILSPADIGIILLPSAMMSPEKSITGVCIAAGHVPYRTPCPACRKKDCRYRRNAV